MSRNDPELMEILQGEANYQEWAYRTANRLAKKNLKSIVVNRPEEEKKNAQWHSANEVALSILSETIPRHLLGHIMNFTEAHEAWAHLESTFDRKSTFSQISLRRSLYSMKKGNQDMIQFLSNVKQVKFQLDRIVANKEDSIGEQ